jgi:hypothetical protein
MMFMWITQHRAGKRQTEEDDVALLHGCPATDPQGLTTIVALGSYLEFCIALDPRVLDCGEQVPAVEVAEHNHFLELYREFKAKFANDYYLGTKKDCCHEGTHVDPTTALFQKDTGRFARRLILYSRSVPRLDQRGPVRKTAILQTVDEISEDFSAVKKMFKDRENYLPIFYYSKDFDIRPMPEQDIPLDWDFCPHTVHLDRDYAGKRVAESELICPSFAI